MNEPTFTKAELMELVGIWRERAAKARESAAKAREKSNNARSEEGSLFHAGKCIVLSDCADHLEWYVKSKSEGRAP